MSTEGADATMPARAVAGAAHPDRRRSPTGAAQRRRGHPLLRRRGWDEALAREDARCARYGRPAAVLTIRSDFVATAPVALARAVAPAIRASEVAALVAPGEVAVLLVESGIDDAAGLGARLVASLADQLGPVRVGIAERHATGLRGAWSASRVAARSAATGTVHQLSGRSPRAAAHRP